MALDLSTFPGTARKTLIDIGKQFGSSDTLKQADQTLSAHATHGASLADHGFAAADATDLADAKALLVAAGVGRQESLANRKKTSKAYLEAMKEAKKARRRAHSVLHAAAERLVLQPGEAAHDAARAATSAVERTRRAGADPNVLAEQLDLLRGALAAPPIAEVTASRGGPAAVAVLAAAASGVRAVAAGRPSGTGTPEETERLNLIDGLIVTLARRARAAARSASDELGQPAMAKAFELSALYAATASATVEPPPAEPAPPT